MKNLIRNSFYLLVAFLLVTKISVAQSKKIKNTDEKTIKSLRSKEATDRHNESAARVQRLIDRIEKHPDSLALHNLYIYSVGINDSTLRKNYKVWSQKYPDVINIPLAIGVALDAKTPEAADYLLKALSLDSTRADIWYHLAVATSTLGNKLKANQYYKEACVLNPQNADYAYYYAYSFKKLDSVKFREKLFDVVERFAGTTRGAQSLYWLAVGSKDTLTKINLFEKLYKDYKLKNEWGIASAAPLYDLYLQTSPEKALQLCDENHWPPRKIQAEKIIAINNLTVQKSYRQALALVDSLQTMKSLYSWHYLTYKKAELYNLMGNAKTAYDTVLVEMVKAPTYKLRDLLLTYGAKIGKTENDLYADIWRLLDKQTTTAPVFSSKLFTEDKRVSLRDYRGKVTLLTFWFPTCGPCRSEFPRFEKVMKKFDRQQVAYLGVNGMPDEDSSVLKVMESDSLTFTPLHGNSEIAQKIYSFNGYPSNFLIDQEGRIIYSNFRISDDNEDTLELMINLILNKDKYTQPRLMADTMKKN